MTQRYTEADWKAHYERMNNFMATKCDRNLPAEQTPEYKAAAAAIRPEGERSLRYNTWQARLLPDPAGFNARKQPRCLEYGATKYAARQLA